MMETLTLEKKKVVRKLSKRVTGAEAVILSLLAEGVDTIFGYPGGAIMPIYDKLYNIPGKLRHILVRHEQGAAHSAQAYAMVSGKVGVCFATSGPGATNLVTGIANANIDSVPVVFITAQVISNLLGTDAFQEIDIVGISMPITKWNYQVTKVEEIPDAIAKAFFIANSGRPGPVLLDITKDVQVAELDFKYKKCTSLRSYIPYPEIKSGTIDAAAQLINNAKKPFLFIGHGVRISKAQQEVKNFAEKTGIPVASTLLGLSAFPSNHPLYVGMLGMHGNYGPNIKTNECDLIIAVGMRFDDRVTGNLKKYAKQAKIIHIEIDGSEINKVVKVDIEINADAKKTLVELINKVKEKSHNEWVREFKECEKMEYDKVINKCCSPKTGHIKMGEIVRKVSEKTKGEAIVVTDVGQQQMVTARYYKFTKFNSFITSGGMGTMGFGLPAAIGAKIGTPDREVVSFSGDGGFQMTIQEMGTIMQYKLPLKMIILNNNFLGMVRQWQELFFKKRYSATEMITPNFPAIAKGYGIPGKKITLRKELDDALDEMFAYKGAYLLEVLIEKEENIFPMILPGTSVSEIILE